VLVWQHAQIEASEIVLDGDLPRRCRTQEEFIRSDRGAAQLGVPFRHPSEGGGFQSEAR